MIINANIGVTYTLLSGRWTTIIDAAKMLGQATNSLKQPEEQTLIKSEVKN